MLVVLNVAVWFRGKKPAEHGPPRPAPRPDAYVADDPALRIDTLSPRRFAAIDIHEHAQTEADVERLLAAMDRLGIERACFVASSRVTFDHRFAGGFEGFEENNEALLRAKARHPDRVCVFVTLHPPDTGNVERLAHYVARGADGLKLYLGHPGSTATEPFHMMPLDDPRIAPVFAYAEKTQLPITIHVDLGAYGDELGRLLARFPELRVNLPHFGTSKNTAERLERLGRLLDAHPHVYADMSFGHRDIQMADFETLAATHDRVAAFVTQHADRMMFGADLVVTEKTSDETMTATLRSYMQMLEAPAFRFFLRPARPMRGLALPDEVLRKVYRDTPAAFLKLR
ncbi:amidohydrolase 2 [Minicystis rosea]|nr:amidohydrolase 2 [Minicystis rosea]